jgi:hypothetical protein
MWRGKYFYVHIRKLTFVGCISLIGSSIFFIFVSRCVVSIALFPVLQWAYRDDMTKSEIVPQLAYGIEGKLLS